MAKDGSFESGPTKRGFAAERPAPGYDRAFARSDTLPPTVTVAGIDAIVKWFSSDKGYGLVELSNGMGDAVLPIGALQSAGFDTISTGAKLKVYVSVGAQGFQVMHVIEVDMTGAQERAPHRTFIDSPGPARPAPHWSNAVSVAGKVKWFDDSKGFGFISRNDGGNDVFVNIAMLGLAGLSALSEGQPVNMRVVDTAGGREALSLDAPLPDADTTLYTIETNAGLAMKSSAESDHDLDSEDRHGVAEQFMDEEIHEIRKLVFEQLSVSDLDTPNNHLNYVRDRIRRAMAPSDV